MKLAGRGEVTAYDISEISEDTVELSEEELSAVPFTHKRVMEGKVHVLGFDNKLVLKVVKNSTEDKTPPKLNKLKDYEKDGGDASKMNKKMIDNETIEENTRENADAEDGTIFSATKFSEEDRDDYLGRTEQQDVEVSLPTSVKAAAEKRIREIKQSIEDFDDKGYNDGAGANSSKNKAIDAIEQILQNLSTNDLEGYKQAQLFFLTLMSPITDLLPASLVNFLSSGPGPEGTDEITTEIEPFETKLKEAKTNSRKLSDILQESKKGRRKMKGDNPCWDGYEMVGHKTKDGKKVPNCVPVNETTNVTDYRSGEGQSRKELLAKYAKTKDPKDAAAARKAGASQTELKKANDS